MIPLDMTLTTGYVLLSLRHQWNEKRGLINHIQVHTFYTTYLILITYTYVHKFYTTIRFTIKVLQRVMNIGREAIAHHKAVTSRDDSNLYLSSNLSSLCVNRYEYLLQKAPSD